MPASAPDAAPCAPVGAYVTDGHALVQILESDHAGALGEDVLSEQLVELRPDQLGGGGWRRVRQHRKRPHVRRDRLPVIPAARAAA